MELYKRDRQTDFVYKIGGLCIMFGGTPYDGDPPSNNGF